MKIPASEVVIDRRYPVYCNVCGEAVTNERGNSYGFETLELAREAKRRHLEEHESGYLV